MIGYMKVKDDSDVKRTSYIGSSSSSQAAAIEAVRAVVIAGTTIISYPYH
jgi:hypothetical protein